MTKEIFRLVLRGGAAFFAGAVTAAGVGGWVFVGAGLLALANRAIWRQTANFADSLRWAIRAPLIAWDVLVSIGAVQNLIAHPPTLGGLGTDALSIIYGLILLSPLVAFFYRHRIAKALGIGRAEEEHKRGSKAATAEDLAAMTREQD
ncbi:hypothetical protein [Acidihalobacter prosperus]|uniref:Uncharacterized protein n=1 Tax=Acidihalobacter prosperus TaxID=160660 RepID=A0A1A6C6S9_9GAMM|nr:hypothetical protein [Acidihalobacter prosperus]OBS10266.1 hypothetical protein Thpro_021316 [Acidihalobacter prosperus]